MAQAILRQMWCECRRQWDEVSRPAPAPAVSAPGAGSTTGAPLAPLPSDRPPKDFPHWSRLVAAYNGVLVGGEKREFPTIELLGAEEVLSRIHWEHTKSKLYTPVGIGEILAKRTFSALGVVNTLAVKRNSGAPQQLRLVDGNIAVAEDRPFTPKGVWAVVDGITAIKWAWTLIGVGSEKAVEDYAKWWITKARLHSARIDAIADYWEAASQRLASRMRLGHTFDAESAAIIEDHPAFNEAMLASRPPVGKKPGGTAGGTQHQQELPDRGDEDGPARPGKGRGRGRRRPGKRQRETASADQDHDQDWRRGRWGRQADDGGADHNDRGTGGRGQWKWQQWPSRRDDQGRQRREEAEDRRQARPGGGRDQGRDQGRASPESDPRGEVPDRRGEPVRVRPAVKRRRRQVDYVLLSFFDGIGAAPAILEHTHGKPLAAFAWEIDEACIKLTKDRLPWLRHRGDLTSDDPAAVAAAVKKADPEGKALIVVTAAPPCQDFSRIGQSPGHAGQRGALFRKTRSLLPDRRWVFLFENVVMEPAHSDAVSKALGVDPIMVCASDFGWISRPRLWWLYPSILQATMDPASGKPLQWAKHGSYRRLRLEEPRQPESELVVDDLRFHPSVAAGRLKLPCATTPAEDDAGRPAPKRPRPGGRPIPGALRPGTTRRRR